MHLSLQVGGNALLFPVSSSLSFAKLETEVWLKQLMRRDLVARWQYAGNRRLDRQNKVILFGWNGSPQALNLPWPIHHVATFESLLCCSDLVVNHGIACELTLLLICCLCWVPLAHCNLTVESSWFQLVCRLVWLTCLGSKRASLLDPYHLDRARDLPLHFNTWDCVLLVN